MSITKILSDIDGDRRDAADHSKYKKLPSAVKSWMKAWPAQPTNTDILRASQLFFMCPREFVLNYWQPKDNRNFDYKSYLMMSTGTHLHHYLQNYVLGPMGILWGDWIGREGKAAGFISSRGFHPDPKKALEDTANQTALRYEYQELKCFDAQYRIAGRIDGQIDLDRIEWLHKNATALRTTPMQAIECLRGMPQGAIVNLEIKTCGSYPFGNLIDSNSIPEYYKMQAEIYQKMTGVSNTVFWYINRDTMASKLLLYEFTGKWWKDAVRKATIVWRAIRDETLPISAMACHTPKDKRAKECAFRKPCFDEMDFTKYVEIGKERAEKEGRKLLDLSGFESS